MKKEAWILIAVLVVITFLPAVYVFTRPKGFIRIETNGVEMRLSGGLFNSRIITSEQGAVPISEGTYRPVWATITKRYGNKYAIIRGGGSWGRLRGIKVKGSETNVIKLGPPFDIKTNINKRGRNVSIGLEMLGIQGESWRPLSFSSAGRTTNPRLKIINEDGNILASGKFEYG